MRRSVGVSTALFIKGAGVQCTPLRMASVSPVGTINDRPRFPAFSLYVVFRDKSFPYSPSTATGIMIWVGRSVADRSKIRWLIGSGFWSQVRVNFAVQSSPLVS